MTGVAQTPAPVFPSTSRATISQRNSTLKMPYNSFARLRRPWFRRAEFHPNDNHPPGPNSSPNQEFISKALLTSPAAFNQPSLARQVAEEKGILIEPARVIAIVGDQSILVGDLGSEIHEIRERLKDQISDDEFKTQRPLLIKQLLKQKINTMLVYHDFLRKIPPERHSEIMANINEQFTKSQLDVTLKKNKVDNVAELDNKLRQKGSSLKKLKRSFAEHVIAQQMIRQNTDPNKEITHDEMLEYYREYIKDFKFPAKTKWEELVAEHINYRLKSTAKRDIAAMGNQVLRGAPLSAVAKRSRQGPRWEQGGMHEWTTQGNLNSTKLDESIFSLPVGKLSQIIEDDDGFHIIRVVQRVDAGRVPFFEAQVEIKEKIKEERRKRRLEEYIVRLREKTRVWTMFDGEPHLSKKSNTPSQSTR